MLAAAQLAGLAYVDAEQQLLCAGTVEPLAQVGLDTIGDRVKRDNALLQGVDALVSRRVTFDVEVLVDGAMHERDHGTEVVRGGGAAEQGDAPTGGPLAEGIEDPVGSRLGLLLQAGAQRLAALLRLHDEPLGLW